ncbi:MAG: hypothetical protein HY721_22490 [Planctomycetes bacterium]|nr:hypothetical protein [Planctomycetota bacterium]
MKRSAFLAGAASLLLLLSLSCSQRDPRVSVERTAHEPQLVAEALRILELVEQGSFEESLKRIGELRSRFAGDASLRALDHLLSAWTERRRQALAAPGPLPSPPPGDTLAAQGPAVEAVEGGPRGGSGGEAELLKKQGIDLYIEGKLEDALRCWRRTLELDPADDEARQFIHRAEMVLGKRERQEL